MGEKRGQKRRNTLNRKYKRSSSKPYKRSSSRKKRSSKIRGPRLQSLGRHLVENRYNDLLRDMELVHAAGRILGRREVLAAVERRFIDDQQKEHQNKPTKGSWVRRGKTGILTSPSHISHHLPGDSM